jgi:hypothetical protein
MYLHHAQLLIKFYQDKPSRIGIKYTYEFQALKPYEELVRNYPEHTFTLRLEPKNDHITLTLLSDQCGERVIYKDLGYKKDQLTKLIQIGYKGMPLEFVHIYSEANTMLIAKPFKKQTFFSISSYEVIGINEFY